MATRKTIKKLVDTLGVKTLDPKDADTKYFGAEPAFIVQPENRNIELIRSFNWYSRFYGRKDAKDLIVQYLDLTGNDGLAKVVRKVDESNLNPSLCWLARLTLRGLQLTDEENKRLQDEINRLVKSVTDPEYKESQLKVNKKPEVKVEVSRPNVQEIMKEKAREAAGEIEGMFDDYLLAGAKSTFNFKPLDELAKKNVLPQHIYIFTDAWNRKRNEIEEAMQGKDSQLVQAYSHYTKTQLKNILKFIDQCLSDFNSYVSIKKAAKAKPRTRKAVPVEKIVAKLKFMKAFKDAATKLDLISLHPIKLHGASEAWVYDTAKRKLHHYLADEYSKTFTVKGNTLLGFDNNQSEVKTLRKPAEQIKEIMGSKPAARKYFKDIKAVATSPNGRFNDAMIILKAF
jgi:hypothetical protein